MNVLIWLFILAAFIIWYVIWGRPWLKEKPWMAWFYKSAVGEWLELHIHKKSETILMARFEMALGAILTILTSAGTIDITPIMPFVPDAWETTVRAIWNLIPLSLTVLGMVHEKLRNETTLPIDVVALPENKAPEVAAVVEKLKEVKVEAIVKVAEAKAEGVV